MMQEKQEFSDDQINEFLGKYIHLEFSAWAPARKTKKGTIEVITKKIDIIQHHDPWCDACANDTEIPTSELNDEEFDKAILQHVIDHLSGKIETVDDENE